VIGINEQNIHLPAGGSMQIQVLPNPTNGQFLVNYTIDKPQAVTLKLYHLQGEQMEVLADGILGAGTWQTTYTKKMAAGIYFVKLEAGGKTAVQRLMVY
jgi:hypothetical protein